MDSVVAGFIGTAIGGVISHVNGVVQWRRQQKHERKRSLLSKLEELCSVVINIQTLLNKDAHDALRNKVTVEAAQRQYSDVPITQMQMLVGLYFPQLEPHATKINSARVLLALRINDSLAAHAADENYDLDVHMLTACDSTQATGACDDFLRAAAKVASTLA